MPYVHPRARSRLDAGGTPHSAGELNYVITREVTRYLERERLQSLVGINYQILNDTLGALEGAKQEFYRRVVAPYEDEKIVENGDVYPPT